MARGRAEREELLGRFRGHFAAREYLKALEICVKMAEEDPRDAQAWRNLGVSYVALGYDAEAADVLKRALGLAPGDAYTCYNLGVIASHKGQHEEAIARYERALELMPDLTGAYVGIASSLYRLGDYDGALYNYSRAYLLDPDNPDVARSFGVTLMQTGHLSKASFYLKQAVTARPEWAAPRFELGEALRRMGFHREAVRELLRGLRRKRTGEGLTVLARVYLDCGKLKKALVRAGLAAKLDPRNALAHRVLGMCRVKVREWGEAVASFEEAYRLSPDDPETVLELAAALTEAGRDLERARGMAAAALQHDPRNPRALDILGRCLLKQGRTQEAARVLEDARSLLETGGVASDSAIDIYRHLTEVYEKLGDRMMVEEMWWHTGGDRS